LRNNDQYVVAALVTWKINTTIIIIVVALQTPAIVNAQIVEKDPPSMNTSAEVDILIDFTEPLPPMAR
jgi:hypothetical protein